MSWASRDVDLKSKVEPIGEMTAFPPCNYRFLVLILILLFLSDLSLQTSLCHEYQKRMGLGVLAVRVAASGRSGRFAVIYFSTMGDVNRALERTSSANKAASAGDSGSSQPPSNPNFSGLLAGAEAEVFLADEEVIDDK